MAIVFDSDAGTITGLSVGGLPDGVVDAGTLAANAVTAAKIATNSVDSAELIDGAVDDSHIAALASSKLTGALPAISGAALTGISGGKVLQAVSAIKTGGVHITSTTYADSGLTASITPASGSKVLVFVNQLGCNTEAGTTGSMSLNLVRDSTELDRIGGGIGWNDTNTWSQTNVSFTYLDSSVSGDGSTSFTYKTQGKLNHSSFDGYLQNAYAGDSASSITLLEIGA